MKKTDIYNQWNAFIHSEEFRKYFLSNEEEWENNLKESKLFITTNKKRPNTRSQNKDEKQLGKWLGTQITNSNNKTHIMKNPEIYNQWNAFTQSEEYSKYF
jgi:hypothetical protein